ncbi:uncharacterized protein LOC131626203 [Vicia villosa]|uniref:uncharacterized protein LOC131626203 n=1 Tax=Vicia villosa TaxID=3911 RepID=UPI00273AF2C3|nr:uncharacterized protein LOC131626203 [Vicia villosa]
MLETQISQVAQTQATQTTPGGKFPRQTQPNPRGQANAITLRSGTTYDGLRNPMLSTPEKLKENVTPMDQVEKPEKSVKQTNQGVEIKYKDYTPPPPLDDPKPLECNFISKNKLAKKEKDPGSFSIPYILGNHMIDKAFLDLGASVSLMPLAVCKRLNLGELQSTKMSLQLADRFVKYPMGILEDIPVKISQLYIPTDFIVMDIKEDDEISILLGRPFFSTFGAIIDVKKGNLTFEGGDEKI